MEIIPFDWHRIFIGNQDIWLIFEIVFRTIFLYVYVLFITRLVGRRRSLGKLTPLELIFIIVLGPSAGGGMVNPEIPLFYAMAVITVLSVSAHLGALLARKYKVVHNFLEGEPLLVIKNGKILFEALKKENITEKEVKRGLREEGYHSPEEIKEAYFEASGQISIFPYKQKSEK